jgi:Tol biopolymer transport system component/DNA-binding winged helix-turn-helix (wHTH) protein
MGGDEFVIEHKPFVFTFADVEVREREFCIVKAGEVLPVEPKAFRVLVFLLRSPHRLITKDELLDAVWNDCAVSENSLTRSIALLRRLLGDDTHEPRYIATVPTVGYRFLCDVEVVEEGFPGVGAADRHHPANGNELESLNGTPSVQTSSLGPQGQTAVAEKVEEKVEQLSDEGRRRSRRLLVSGLVTATLVILVTGFLFYQAMSNRDTRTGRGVQPANAAAASSRMRIVPLTNLSGWVRYPAFSPDGEKIAFIWNGENPVMGDLYVQLVGGERPLRLTHTSSGYICCADWSPDGRQIAFGRCDDHGGGVFIVPALGGPERKLTDVICPHGDAGYPKWIADGKSLLLADSCVAEGPRGLVVFSLGTGEKRCLTAPPLYSEYGDSDPAVSPDGKTVAFERHTTIGPASVYTVALSGGNPRQVSSDGWAAWNPMWSSDGQHIIFDSPRTGLNRVWRVPATGGAMEPETVYPAIGALSRDGRRLAYVEPLWFWQGRAFVISRIELSNAGGQVVSQKQVIASDGGNESAQPSPDGRQIVFQSNRTGRPEIWRSDADGSDLLQLTSFDNGFSGTPRWSPDGKWIAFDHHHETHSQIYLIDSEGRNMHAVTSGNYENMVPGWSRDGTAVYFASNRAGSLQVWRRELATGRETQVTHHGGFAAFESYDAKTLYYSRFEGGGIWSMPVGGGEEQQVTDALHKGYWGHFAVTDAGLYLVNSEAAPKPTLMFYNFQTRLLTPVLQLEDPSPTAPNLAASRDGRTLWSAHQAARHSSLAMAENFQ